MAGCLILYHTTITSLTKCMILRAMFYEEDFEIHVTENNTVVTYLWNVKEEKILQAIHAFESTNIFTGYGEGKIKKDAKDAASEELHRKISLTLIK